MSYDPRDAFRGALIVASRDLRANARGLKVWIISGLTLLAILGAAFGIGGLTSQGPPVSAQYILWSAPYWPANNSTAGIRVWMSDYLGTPRAGFLVLLGNPYPPNAKNPPFVQRANLTTNATGWGSFPALGPGTWPLQYTAGATTSPPYGVGISVRKPIENLSVTPNRFELIGDGARRDVSLQAMWIDGTPAAHAQVLVNGTVVGETNQDGFFHRRLDDGEWNVTVTYRGASWEHDVVVTRSPLAILPLLQGPDALLLFLGVGLMGFFAPIISIAMSYDAVAKERMQGSLELLLARPASRTGIAIGKFLGSFLSVGLPMLGVLLGAVIGVAGTSGKWPDLVFVVAFVIGTLGLIAVYVLIMQIFSTLAKSAGTAILSALVVWIVFNIVWQLVFLAAESAFGIQGGTPAAFSLSTITTLFNPNGVYELMVTTFVPVSTVGLFGTTGGGSLPDWTGPVAMVIWIGILLILAVIVFRKRIV
jgi:ABC-type transport system involved in multi-copper enzyme maturation permease subunit